MAVFVVTSNGETVEGTSGHTLLSRAGLGGHLLSSFRQQFKAKVYSEDGEIRPIMAVVELPKRGSISVRNLGQVSRAGQEEGSQVELLRQAWNEYDVSMHLAVRYKARAAWRIGGMGARKASALTVFPD